MIQMQPPRCSVKKVFWQISKKYTGKHQGLFFNKVAGIKTSLGQVFSCEFCEIFKNTFFTEHLWTTASGDFNYLCSFPQALFSIKKNGNLNTSKTLNWEENQQQHTFCLFWCVYINMVRSTYFRDNILNFWETRSFETVNNLTVKFWEYFMSAVSANFYF